MQLIYGSYNITFLSIVLNQCNRQLINTENRDYTYRALAVGRLVTS